MPARSSRCAAADPGLGFGTSVRVDAVNSVDTESDEQGKFRITTSPFFSTHRKIDSAYADGATSNIARKTHPDPDMAWFPQFILKLDRPNQLARCLRALSRPLDPSGRWIASSSWMLDKS
jgi:hypothetical protein